MDTQQELDMLKRRLAREINSRKQAEAILEQKALELYKANMKLRALNDNLELKIQERTKELEASEMRYRQIVETANDIIYRADEHGYFTYANPQAEKLLGYTNEEVIGKHFMELIPEDYRAIVNDFYKKNRDNQQTNTYLEFPVTTKSGNIKWLGQNVQMILRDGKVAEAAAVARDITKRRAAEDALQTTQLRLTTLISNLQSGILVEDENRHIVLTNERFCKKFGIQAPPESLVGMDCSQSAEQSKHLFYDSENFVERINELLAKREPCIDEVLNMADGCILLRDYIPIAVEGRYLGHLWQYRDVTTERRAEEQLRRSEEKYRGIIENMELGLLEVDNLGRIVRAYHHFCEMTGYVEEEIQGLKADEVFLPKEFLPVMKRQAVDRMKGKAGIYEVQMFKKDGSRMWVMISGAPIYNKWGAVVGTIGIHYDVTKQKQLQQELFEARLRAESAQEAEKQFLANMSHEIRTPLNAIIGMTHLLYDTKPNSEQQNYLEVLKSSSVILQSLINDLLDISKIKAGKMEVHPKEFDLTGLVRTIQKTFQLKLENKPVEVGAEIDHHLNTVFIGDDLMLNQILLNLLGNAEKFTPEGKIGMRVTQKDRSNNEVTIQFEVYDTGIGIPQDKIDLIFQSFRQVDGDIKRRFGGTGLGLSIVKNLVELQGGTLRVDSQEGVGTIFTFILTYKDTGLMPIKSVALPKAFDSFCSSDCKVLVVEDNSMNRRYLGSLLDKWGIQFDVAVNGKEGFEMAQHETYSLIFMDIQMPIMDGYEAAIAIRSTLNPNQETPILALTASAMLSRKDKAFQVGMNGYVSKPFTPEQLLETLTQFIQLNKTKEAPSSEVVEVTSGGQNEEFAFSPDLDAERLHDLYGTDTEYALDMFDAFFEKMEKEYPQLGVLLQDGEYAALSKMAHKLKPTFPMVGLTGMERHFQQLEDEAQDPTAEPALIRSIFKEIEEKLAGVLPIAETERLRLRSLCNTLA